VAESPGKGKGDARFRIENKGLEYASHQASTVIKGCFRKTGNGGRSGKEESHGIRQE